MSILEGNKATLDADHVLFVPPGISREAQIDRGVELIRSGYSVRVHEHSSTVGCTPNGAVERCGTLRIIDDRATVVPDSNTEQPDN